MHTTDTLLDITTAAVVLAVVVGIVAHLLGA
jgi:hypothetical protein